MQMFETRTFEDNQNEMLGSSCKLLNYLGQGPEGLLSLHFTFLPSYTLYTRVIVYTQRRAVQMCGVVGLCSPCVVGLWPVADCRLFLEQ